MKRRILAILLATTLVVSSLFSVYADNNGENWEEGDFGANISFSHESNTVSGSYELGTDFVFITDSYCDKAKDKEVIRKVTVEAFEGYDNTAITNLQYMEGTTWTDISEFNTQISFKNDVGRKFRVTFSKDGVYVINHRVLSTDETVLVAAIKTRYVTIEDGTFSISTDKPENPTTEEVSEETTTPEVVVETTTVESSEETTTPEASVEPTTTEESSEETTTPEVPVDPTTTSDSSEETTTPEASVETSTSPVTSVDPTTTEAPVDPTTPEASVDPTIPAVTTTPEQTSSNETTIAGGTSESQTTGTALNNVKKPAKVKISKIYKKKKSAKKLILKVKKATYAKGYQVKVFSSKKNATKNKKEILTKYVNKTTITVASKKLKNKNKLYVRVRAYSLGSNKKRIYGSWSSVKKVIIK